MTEYEYLHEAGKNYLSIGETRKGDYITEMLIHNNIPGFAEAQLRSRNAESLIVYSVSGLISIKQVLEIKKLSGEDAESLVKSLIKACKGMEDYLLPFHRLNLRPEYIYENYGRSSEFLWIYGGEEEGSPSELFAYLLDKTDSGDERAIQLIYGLYRACKGFEVFGEEERGSAIGLIAEKAEELMKHGKDAFDLNAKMSVAEENRMLEQFEEEERGEFFERCRPIAEERKEKEKEERRKGGFYTEEREKRGRGRKERKQEKKRGKKTAGGSSENSTGSGGTLKSVILTAWEYLKSDVGGGKQKEAICFNEKKEEERPAEIRVVKREKRQGEVGEQRTALLTNGMVRYGVYCLKPEGSGESPTLITSYPFFLGKADKEVNFIIEDSTVSRYHARIDRTEDDFFLTDLGSTNGTFLNGIRAVPYERMLLNEGDTIAISRKRYEFRYVE